MLRTGILTGVCICVLTVTYSIHRYPGIVASPGTPILLSLFLAGVLWYGFAAVRWTRVTTCEDFLVLRHGARWGVAIGLAWTVEVVGGNVIMPHQLDIADYLAGGVSHLVLIGGLFCSAAGTFGGLLGRALRSD